MKENDVHEREEEFFVRLFDDQTFETLAKYPLEPNENDASIISCCFDGDLSKHISSPHGHGPTRSRESSRGRILVFKVSDTASNDGGNGVVNASDHDDDAPPNRPSASHLYFKEVSR